MNQNNESPIDPMHEPDPPKTQERLAEIEQQLKKARPRPVELDADELLRLASVAPMPERSTAPPPQRRRYRSAALTAGSWACGAIVGGIVMFLVMRQDDPAAGPPSTTAGVTHEPSVNLAQDKTTSAPSHHELSPLDEAVLALTGPGGDWPLWEDGLCLQAGMSLPQLTSSTWERLPVPGDTSQSRPASGTFEITPTLPGGYPPSSPGVTRERLMRDLLDESSDFLL